MTTTNLTWTKPELLTDAAAWECKTNAIELLRERGEAVTNETVRDFCADAISFLATLTSPGAMRLVAGYRAVRSALAVA
jgi:hypothetical protein